MKKINGYMIALIVVAVIVGAMFVPVTVSKPVEKSKIETYQEPEQVSLSYEVLERSPAYGVHDVVELNAKAAGYVKIKNTDTEPGTFKVNCHFRTAERDFYPSNRKYIEPGETKKIECIADTNFGEQASVSYEINPGTKEVTRTKERTREEVVMESRTLSLYQAIYWKYL